MITKMLDTDGGRHFCPECFGEVDTWVVERAATLAERARIISLLEVEQASTKDTAAINFDDLTSFSDVIAIIKGE